MERSLLVNIHNVKINGFTIQQSLQYLDFVVVPVRFFLLLLFHLNFNEAIKDGRSAILVSAVNFDSIFQ